MTGEIEIEETEIGATGTEATGTSVAVGAVRATDDETEAEAENGADETRVGREKGARDGRGVLAIGKTETDVTAVETEVGNAVAIEASTEAAEKRAEKRAERRAENEARKEVQANVGEVEARWMRRGGGSRRSI